MVRLALVADASCCSVSCLAVGLMAGLVLLVVPLVFALPAVDNRLLFNLDLGSLGVIHVTLLHVGIFLAGLPATCHFSAVFAPYTTASVARRCQQARRCCPCPPTDLSKPRRIRAHPRV